MVSCTVCGQVKEPSMASATTVEGKGQGKKGDSKGWTVGKGWSDSEGWNSSGKGWEQQRPAGMNNLERASKQYDALVMEMSTQEKTMRDSDWCVPVKHVANQDKHQILC